MLNAIKYWRRQYDRKCFVRFSIIDKKTNAAIGTIELFNRIAEDYFNNCGIVRLDVRSDYEDSYSLYDIMSIIIEKAFEWFDCDMIATKARSYTIERISALKRLGFEKTNERLIGQDGNVHGKGGFRNPEQLFQWLYDNKPKEDLVLSHGDFCLPNIFLKDNSVSGFIDLGNMGIADRYQDIALCYRSLNSNYAGRCNGKSYGKIDENILFTSLGIKPDYEKIRYYILLDELF